MPKICKDGRIWGQNNRAGRRKKRIKKGPARIHWWRTGGEFKAGHAYSREVIERREKTKKRLLKSGKILPPSWKGGKRLSRGYMMIRKNGKYRQEHRLLLEKQLGRPLTRKEITHHLNGKKDDNRLSNLMLFRGVSPHVKFHKEPSSVEETDIVFDGRKEEK